MRVKVRNRPDIPYQPPAAYRSEMALSRGGESYGNSDQGFAPENRNATNLGVNRGEVHRLSVGLWRTEAQEAESEVVRISSGTQRQLPFLVFWCEGDTSPAQHG